MFRLRTNTRSMARLVLAPLIVCIVCISCVIVWYLDGGLSSLWREVRNG